MHGVRFAIPWVFLERNPSTSFFYLVTMIHGLHLVGGLVAWVRASLRIRRGAAIAQVRMSIEMCAVYWHFLLRGVVGFLWVDVIDINRVEIHDTKFTRE